MWSIPQSLGLRSDRRGQWRLAWRNRPETLAAPRSGQIRPNCFRPARGRTRGSRRFLLPEQARGGRRELVAASLSGCVRLAVEELSRLGSVALVHDYLDR